MHTLRLKLKTNRQMKRILEKRYRMTARIHNTLVNHVKRQLTKLKKIRDTRLSLSDIVRSGKRRRPAGRSPIRQRPFRG